MHALAATETWPRKEDASQAQSVLGFQGFLDESTVRQLRAGEHAFFEGDVDSHIYRIASGIVRLYRLLPDGRRQIIGFKYAGSLIGLDTGGQRYCSAEAVTPVTLRCLPLRVAHRRLKEDADFGSELISLLSAELADARNQLAVLNRRSAIEKVAAFILDLFRRQNASAGVSVDFQISRSDMADFLGLTIETVSRTLTKLKLRKVIALPTAQRLVVLEMNKLESLAAGEMFH